ncbi:MAG: class I SAM-dependent methyltransferase [Acidimicrobiia bacterium]
MPAREWNARSYHRVSGPLEEMGREVLERLPLRGDETVLDAGCGTGRVTALLVDRLPRGKVIAVDVDAEMVRLARQNLGPRVDVRLADLTELALERPVDAVFSTATFHWISNQQRLYQRLFANLVPGGRLVAQFGGAGNVARILEAAARIGRRTPFAHHFHGWERPSRFPSPEETGRALERTGFTEVHCWLESRPVVPDDPVTHLATISLGPHLERLPVGKRSAFVEQVAASLNQPVTIDYVRLNVDAVRPGLPSPRPPPQGRGR